MMHKPFTALLQQPAGSAPNEDPETPFDDPWEDAFMARSIVSLAEHLREFLLKL
jgi:hypothetical protein